MEKNYENNLTREQMKKLTEKYQEVLEKYEISLEECQTCNLTEFLAKQHPDRYDNHIYRSSRELQEICAVISKEKNIAVMINLNEGESSKIPQGEFGIYDLEKHQFQASDLIKGKIREQVEKMSNGTFTPQEQDEIAQELLPKNLDDMEKIATVDMEIERKTKNAVNNKIDEKNSENGIPKEEREAAENDVKKQAMKKEVQEKLPPEVRAACQRLGITNVKSYFYVNANQLSSKIEGTAVNKNGGQVLMIEVEDSVSLTVDRFYGFQDEKMILHGTHNEEVDRVVGDKNNRDGKVIEPLKMDNPTVVEFSDSEGTVVREQLEEDMNLSVQEIENYKKEVEKLLEKYSQEIEKIKETAATPEEAETMVKISNQEFNFANEELAKKYGIDLSDAKSINLQTEEHTEEKVDDEPEAFEVPGKREH